MQAFGRNQKTPNPNVERGISNDEVKSFLSFGVRYSLFDILRFGFELLYTLRSIYALKILERPSS